jgi:adenine-specific DNA-methyltransferase
MSKYDDLISKLKEIFQIDKPELDFGVYRILNARAVEINDYLEKRLKAKVTESLASAGSAEAESVKKELAEAEKNAASLGVPADAVPKVKELRQKLARYGAGSADHENAVFTHLLTFFSRYYDSGDFISQRRYKGDTYAIPYAGEEVMLHWANKDQYYTKSGENFSNYAFKLEDGRVVRFKLITADTAKDNRKDNDKERRFALIEAQTRTLIDEEGDEYEQTFLPITEEVNLEGTHELVIRFEYKAYPKGTKQETLSDQAIKVILEYETIKTRWLDLSKREPTEKKPSRTLLEKCLNNYTSKNTADYFIHKDLGGFLKRELDFYIKNEVMHLDDVQNALAFADIEKNLRMIQTLRSIAQDIITFLAQLEDFQKKLWLKKKFVVSTNYCITLDRIDESLFPQIAANPKQWEQWKQLGMLEDNIPKVEAAIAHLKANPFLMIDTYLFDPAFKFALLKNMDKVDETLDGVLINGDNFQALKLIQKFYSGRINCIYIDPPYNTDASSIVYKNGYKNSTWASMMDNRLEVATTFIKQDGIIAAAIDDEEVSELRFIMNSHFPKQLGIAVVRSNPAGRKTTGKLAPAHEYNLFFGQSEGSTPESLSKSDKSLARYPKQDDKGRFAWANFIRSGNSDKREDRPTMFYPIFVRDNDELRIPKMDWDDTSQSFIVREEPAVDEQAVYPVLEKDGKLIEKRWQRGSERVGRELEEFRVRRLQNNKVAIDFKTRMDEDALPITWWEESGYASANYGALELKQLFSEKSFDFPKAKLLVSDTLRASGLGQSKSIALDFFAGSGTTGHAVIDLNRDDQGKRKFILIEQGEYFDIVTKPRIQKVVFSADWKNGKATAPKTGISHTFKVLKIESYEDTLNNLQLNRSPAQQDLLTQLPETAQDDYLMRYMLDVESKDSLLSVKHFNKPFDYKLKIAVDSAGAYEEKPVDLVETFNYLIGLHVFQMDYKLAQGFATVTGRLPGGEKTLVLWRDTKQVDYEALIKLCAKLAINPADSEYDVVFINGDHNIPTSFTALENEGGITKTLKIRSIEEAFLSAMFDVEDV